MHGTRCRWEPVALHPALPRRRPGCYKRHTPRRRALTAAPPPRRTMPDDVAPDILRLPRAWDADSAARRIAQLETALMRRSELLEQKQAQLDALQRSGAWR